MNIRLITEMLNLKNVNFYENANGITEFMTFMNRLMRRDRLEFMENVADRNSFLKLLLESTQDDGKGLEFVLKNMETPNFYESGKLTFRKLLL